MCFFNIDFSALFLNFWRFWLDFGRPKIIEKLKQMQQHRKKNEKTSILGRALFGGRPPEGFGRVLGGFWESFERIWGGFGGVTLDGQDPPYLSQANRNSKFELRWFPLGCAAAQRLNF